MTRLQRAVAFGLGFINIAIGDLVAFAHGNYKVK
jgi:hypothetical protein